MSWLGALLLALGYAAALLAAGFLVGSWLAGLTSLWLQRTRLDPEVRQLAVSAVRPTVLALAIIAAVESLGVDLTGVVALLAVVFLTIGLSLTRTLSNASAGGWLLTVRPFRVGDVVEIGPTAAGQPAERGVVVDSSILATTLRTADGVLVTVPNRLVLDAPIRNLTRTGLRRVEVPVLVDPAQAEDTAVRLRQLIVDEPRLLPDPAPVVRVEDRGDGLYVVASAWARPDDAPVARSELLRKLRAPQLP